MDAERVGAAQARTEVMRILHAVENEEEWRIAFRQPLQHFVDVDDRSRRCRHRDDSLVTAITGQFIERVAVDRLDNHARFLRQCERLFRARIASIALHVDARDGQRIARQARRHRMKTEQDHSTQLTTSSRLARVVR